jgi:hypothetical protein
VTDKLLVAGAAYPFFGKADKSSTAGYIASEEKEEHKTCCSPPPHGRFAIVSGTRRAKLARTGALTFAVRPGEAGAATARAFVKVGARKLRFKTRALRLAARATRKITIKLSRSAARRVLSALRAHRKLTATITVSMVAGNGDTGRLVLAVRLRR